MRAAIP